MLRLLEYISSAALRETVVLSYLLGTAFAPSLTHSESAALTIQRVLTAANYHLRIPPAPGHPSPLRSKYLHHKANFPL